MRASSLGAACSSKPTAWVLVDALKTVAELALSPQLLDQFHRSAWCGRMLSHLHGSPSHVHLPIADVLPDSDMRCVACSHALCDARAGQLGYQLRSSPYALLLYNSLTHATARSIGA